jgi:hypothetical protein
MSNPLLLVVLCLGLLLWRGMVGLCVPVDGFVLALVFVLLAATLLPFGADAVGGNGGDAVLGHGCVVRW